MVSSKTSKVLTARAPPIKLFHSPADPRPAPDDRGEDDWTFFRRRPGINRRVRFSTDGEFGPEIAAQARGRAIIVMVAVGLNASGIPTRARAFTFSEIEGGRA